MADVRAGLVRRGKSQNRQGERDGSSGYGEHYNVEVCEKHSVHDGLQRNSHSPNQMPYQLGWKAWVPGLKKRGLLRFQEPA
jgi:hypothetical protein